MNADAIVKALKCCNVPSGIACSECPYHDVGEECRTKRNKDAASLIEEISKEHNDLKYILMGVMHFVDKWLDGDELDMDEVNRALRMREKTLEIIEELTAENEELEDKVRIQHKIINERAEDIIRHDNFIRDLHKQLESCKADTVHKMQERLKYSLCCIPQCHFTYAEVEFHIDRIAKEMLED